MTMLDQETARRIAGSIPAGSLVDRPVRPSAEARTLVEPVTLADVLDALNLFNRPKPSEDDGPWEGGHFIRVDHLPDFINIIAAAWFSPAPLHASPERDILRAAQAEAVMPLIGPLLDAWECCSQSVREEHPELDVHLRRINRATEDAGEGPNGADNRIPTAQATK